MSIYVPKVAYVTKEKRKWHPSAVQHIPRLEESKAKKLIGMQSFDNNKRWLSSNGTS